MEKKANMNKNSIDTLLEEIAKIFLVTGSFSQNQGLYYGKTGAAAFLYSYYMHTENEFYGNYADEILLEITSQLNESKLHYTDGISGIAWGINHLLMNDFIDVSQDSDIFSNITRTLIRATPPIDLGVESFGISSYFYCRIKDNVTNEQEELENLLLLERIIAHIDNIDTNEGKNKLINLEQFYDMMEEDRKLGPLEHFIETNVLSAVHLKKAFQKRIYIDVTSRLVKEVELSLWSIVEKMCCFIIKKPPSEHAYRCKMIYQLCISYSAYLQLVMLKRTEYIKDLFVTAIAALENMDACAFEKEKKVLNASTEVKIITILRNINIILSNDILSKLLKERTLRLVAFLYQDSNLVNSFLWDKVSLNIGLTGLSGLGLMLLDEVCPQSREWERGLMFT